MLLRPGHNIASLGRSNRVGCSKDGGAADLSDWARTGDFTSTRPTDEGPVDSKTLKSIFGTCPGVVSDDGPGRRKLPAASGTVPATIRHSPLVNENQFRRPMYSRFALVDDHDRRYLGCRSTEAWSAVVARAVVSLFFESRRARDRFIQALDRRHVPAAAWRLIDRG
jgi:hypothetical protein